EYGYASEEAGQCRRPRTYGINIFLKYSHKNSERPNERSPFLFCGRGRPRYWADFMLCISPKISIFVFL
ncbi:MAG: hypothetical protein II793_00400, partial [Bacteroidales bacterium]|nr:hypothetical protein [Bacteroidales bacterium]